MDPRILIVDDSRLMRQFICRSLHVAGLAFASCTEASNGKEAMEILHEQDVDLLLCDVNMPEMSGEELLQAIRHNPRLCFLSILVISSDATAPRLQRMLDLGAHGYLLKPFPPELLVSEVKRVLLSKSCST